MERSTVCIRSFNRPERLAEAVDSCLNQTTNSRIVIVDDGSALETRNEAAKLAQKFARIELVQLRTNQGPSAALLAGIDACQTEFLGFLDSDDLLDERYVEKMEQALDENLWAQAAYCRYVGGPQWKITGDNIYREVLRQGHLSALGTLFVRREVIQELPRLPTRVEIGCLSDACDDDRLSFELSKRGGVIHVPEELYSYRTMAEGRLTGNREVVARAWLRFYADYSEDYWREVGGFWLGWRLGNLFGAFKRSFPVRTLIFKRAEYGLELRPGLPIFCVGFLLALLSRITSSTKDSLRRKVAVLITRTKRHAQAIIGALPIRHWLKP